MRIRELEMLEGITKICVPLTGETVEELRYEAEKIITSKCDLVELRIDCFHKVESMEETISILKMLREILGEKPIIFTFRTKNEGGNKEFSLAQYEDLLETVIKTKLIDVVDIELFIGDENCKKLIKVAKENNVYTILSNHDFNKTPTAKEIEFRLTKMLELNADIPKIAVTPTSKQDVLVLIAAVLNFKEKNKNIPVIAISMKEIGSITRLICDFMGTSVTFATVEKSSAPGQLNAEIVYEILHNLS